MRVRLSLRALHRWEGLTHRVAEARAQWRHPSPRVSVDIGPAVRVWWLRAAMVLAAAVCAGVVARGPVSGVLLAGALVGLAVRPGGSVPAAFTGLATALWVLRPAPDWTVESSLLVLGLPLVVLVGQTVGTLPLAGLVEVDVIWPAVRRLLVVEAVVQPCGLLAGALSTSGLAVPWLPLLLAIALVAVSLAVLPRLTPRG